MRSDKTQPKNTIVIVGGGLMGLLSGIALQDRFHVKIIDPRLDLERLSALSNYSSSLSQQPTARVIALNPASQAFMQGLGVWPAMQSHANAYQGLWIQDSANETVLTFDGQSLGQYPMGWMIENNAVLNALKQSIDPTRCEIISAPFIASEQDAAALANGDIVINGKNLHADVIIAADGSQSALRAATQVDVHYQPYNQSGVVMTIEHDAPNNNIARQWFLGKDILALLPVDSHHCSIVWSTSDPDSIKNLSQEALQQTLHAYTQHSVGHITDSTQPVSFPLAFSRVCRFTHGRVVFVGDAAHQVHPMAGLGANLGFADVQALAKYLSTPASTVGLEKYRREREWQNKLAQQGIDALFHTFQAQNPLWSTIRGLGIQSIESLPIIKKRIAAFAIGN